MTKKNERRAVRAHLTRFTDKLGLAGQGATIDTTTPTGKLVFGIFAALAEFERELIVERTRAGIAAARARGRKGGAPFKMTTAKLRRAMVAMGKPETIVGKLCRELGVIPTSVLPGAIWRSKNPRF